MGGILIFVALGQSKVNVLICGCPHSATVHDFYFLDDLEGCSWRDLILSLLVMYRTSLESLGFSLAKRNQLSGLHIWSAALSWPGS